MWAFVVGLFGGRVLRDGRTPDSVKQARWDRRQSDHVTAERTVGNRGFWPVVAVLGGVCVVAFVVLALTR